MSVAGTSPIEINTYYGLNTKMSRAKIPIGFSPDTDTFHDIDLSSPGVARTRGGQIVINPGGALLGFTPLRIFDYFKPSTDVHTIIGNGSDKLFTMNLLGASSIIASGFTLNQVFDFVNFKDNVFMSNGVDRPKVFDGTTVRNWGIDAPATKPTFAGDTVGALSGEYFYAYTYFNSVTGHESTRSPLSNSHIVLSNTVNLTGLIASTDPQVNQKRIYRTTSGGATLFLLTTIPNSQTSFSDNAGDTTLLSSEAPEDNNPPKPFLGIEEWDGRLWGFEQNSTRIRFSNDEFLTPAGSGLPWESFAEDNNIDFGVKVLAVKKSPNFHEVWVHTEGGLYAVARTGVPEDPYNARLRNAIWFTVSHYSVVNIYNDQWFVAPGPKIISLDSTGFLTYESYLIEPTMELMNKVKIDKVQAIHYRGNNKNQYRLIYADGPAIDFNKMIAANYIQRVTVGEGGFRYPSWEFHNINSTCVAIIKDSNETDVLLTGTLNGEIRRQDTSTNDAGVAISWSFSIGWMKSSVIADTPYLDRWLITYFRQLGDWFFNVRTDYDFTLANSKTYPIQVPVVGARWDFDTIWDVFFWAGEGILQRVTTDLGGDYWYKQITWFDDDLDEIFEMHNNIILPIRVEGFRR